ncbi:MAG: tetratricopeptide repeat protein [Lachnotalea sp.]
MNIDSFYNELENYFKKNNLDDVKAYLDKSLEQVTDTNDLPGRLMILNEVVGFNRSVGQDEKAQEFEDKILAIYEEALPLYKALVKGKEYYILSIYSTISNLLINKDKFNESCEIIKKSIEVLRQYEKTEKEIATAYTNLTVNYLRSYDTLAAQECIMQAISIYEAMNEKSEGYGIALTGLAEVYYMKKEYINAIASYKGALDEIRSFYGETPIYAHALENCAKICYDAGYEEDAQVLLEHAKTILD